MCLRITRPFFCVSFFLRQPLLVGYPLQFRRCNAFLEQFRKLLLDMCAPVLSVYDNDCYYWSVCLKINIAPIISTQKGSLFANFSNTVRYCSIAVLYSPCLMASFTRLSSAAVADFAIRVFRSIEHEVEFGLSDCLFCGLHIPRQSVIFLVNLKDVHLLPVRVVNYQFYNCEDSASNSVASVCLRCRVHFLHLSHDWCCSSSICSSSGWYPSANLFPRFKSLSSISMISSRLLFFGLCGTQTCFAHLLQTSDVLFLVGIFLAVFSPIQVFPGFVAIVWLFRCSYHIGFPFHRFLCFRLELPVLCFFIFFTCFQSFRLFS